MNSINFNNLKIIKADTELLSTINFDCGDDDLNEFLLKDSFDNIKNKLSIIYLCYYQKELVGFFTLSADSKKVNNKLKINYRTYPAVKIGRFAVEINQENKGIGTGLIDIIKYALIDNPQSGCRFITVDAYNDAIPFYTKNGFVMVNSFQKDRRTQPMFFDLAQLL